jgi:hypothetical protein
MWNFADNRIISIQVILIGGVIVKLAEQPSSSSWYSRLPSFVWILVIVGGILALIGGVIGLFYGLSNIEGFASVLMLVVAWLVIRFGSSITVTSTRPAFTGQQIVTGVGISFFALMGVAIDQPGNYLYNRPLEWLFCPSGTELHRGVDVTHPVPGQTNVTQDFTCVDNEKNEVADGIKIGEIIATRFVEYVLIGYALIGLSRLYTRIRARPSPSTAGG